MYESLVSELKSFIQNLTFTTVNVQLIKMKMAKIERSYVRQVLERAKLIRLVTNTMENHIIKLEIQECRIIKVIWLHIVMVL